MHQTEQMSFGQRKKLFITKDAILAEVSSRINVQQGADDMVWSIRMDTLELVFASEACLNIFGVTGDEFVRDPHLFLHSIHPQDRSKYYAAISTTQMTGRHICEFRVLGKGGAIKLLLSEAILSKQTKWLPDIMSGIARDITEE